MCACLGAAVCYFICGGPQSLSDGETLLRMPKVERNHLREHLGTFQSMAIWLCFRAFNKACVAGVE